MFPKILSEVLESCGFCGPRMHPSSQFRSKQIDTENSFTTIYSNLGARVRVVEVDSCSTRSIPHISSRYDNAGARVRVQICTVQISVKGPLSEMSQCSLSTSVPAVNARVRVRMCGVGRVLEGLLSISLLSTRSLRLVLHIPFLSILRSMCEG